MHPFITASLNKKDGKTVLSISKTSFKKLKNCLAK